MAEEITPSGPPAPLPNGSKDASLTRFLVIGAGARGHAYAKPLNKYPGVCIAAVAEPISFKRSKFGQRYIWGSAGPQPGQSFESWQDFVTAETTRREKVASGQNAFPGIDGVFICTLDETHAEIITTIAPFGLHIMSEKPLATTWKDCLKIFRALQPPGADFPAIIFSIGHVLHYSPHNILLRKLLLEDQAIGDVLSLEHTEPVGWWHFAHSYVRGNWRKESTTAPSLLTKSCHDIDLLLWLLCPASKDAENQSLHLPSHVSSVGSLFSFKPSRKPPAAGNATNCLSCPAEPECIYSAQKIYDRDRLEKGNAAWPVNIVDPEIEDLFWKEGKEAARRRLKSRLREDYDITTAAQETVDRRSWYGRCVYNAGNDVCDDQIVTMTWDDDEESGHHAKQAVFHMVANTKAQCQRRGRVYGTKGEISYDSRTISVYDFATKETAVFHPAQLGGGHGGGDSGLAQGFANAAKAVNEGSMSVEEAQKSMLGCTLEDVIRSHGIVFAAEEARREKKFVNWSSWWKSNLAG